MDSRGPRGVYFLIPNSSFPIPDSAHTVGPRAIGPLSITSLRAAELPCRVFLLELGGS